MRPSKVSVHHVSQIGAPGLIIYNVVVMRVIPVLRKREYREPRIRTMRRERTTEGQSGADLECWRRDEERRLFAELSQYYPLAENRNVWDRASLLSHSK